MNKTEQQIYDLVREQLTPDLLREEYREGAKTNPFFGHCHHASLAMYHLLGGKENGYHLRKAIDENNIVHYWLENKQGEIIDPTSEQYTSQGMTPPYDVQIKRGVSYMWSNSAKTVYKNVKERLETNA